jgi:hypothetical protein
MAVSATTTTSKLTLNYGEDGAYSITKINPAATDENLLKLANGINAFQEGYPSDIINTVESKLENA